MLLETVSHFFKEVPTICKCWSLCLLKLLYYSLQVLDLTDAHYCYLIKEFFIYFFLNYFVLFVFVLNQRVCIKGLALIKTLIGSVEVYGSVLRHDHDPVEIFCPSTSSLAVLSEHSEENCSSGINLKRTFQDVLQNQPPEVMKKALVRSRKLATVLLMKSLQTVETNFVCSIQRFHDIFSSNLGKVFVGLNF